MPKKRLSSFLSEPQLPESKKNFENTRMKKIREDFNKLTNPFLKPKIKEIRKNLYEIENKKNLSKLKIKEIEQNLIELEKNLFKLNQYHVYDDIEYYGIRDVRNYLMKLIKTITNQ